MPLDRESWDAARLRAPSAALSVAAVACIAATAWSRAGVATALGALAVLGAADVLRRIARSRERTENAVWTWFSRAALAVALGFVAELGTRALIVGGALPSTWEGAGLSVGALGASLLLYQGLVRWNRYRTLVSDPGDWLNGVSAVIALMALGNLISMHTSSALSMLTWWQLQGWLLQIAALVVLVGTTVTVIMIGGLQRDSRAWVFGGALAFAVAAQWLALVIAGRATDDAMVVRTLVDSMRVAWLTVVIGAALAALRRASVLRPRHATSSSTTIGAVVVHLSSVGILLANGVDGDVSHLTSSILAALAALGGAVRVLRLVRELAQLAMTRQEARTDDLTGIANRRALTEAVDAACQRPSGAVLLVIDLDRFKEINDRFGHGVGDELLRLMARRLRRHVGNRGTLARLGGDEFALVLPGTSPDGVDAVVIAEGLLVVLRAPAEVAGRHLWVGASIGIASTRLTLPDQDELMRCADTAMYAAKRAGGGVRVYDEEADRQSREQAQLLEDLRVVLGADTGSGCGSIVVHYQPQVQPGSGKVVGVEALVRWQHPRLGLLAPADFLELAEANGMTELLTRRVMGDALAEAVQWRSDGHELRLAVNLSTSCLADPRLPAFIAESLARHGLPPEQLVIEITETSLMRDPVMAIDVTRRIAMTGVGISIDDYGTGYSSLTYLNDLPASELKLDRSFTAKLGRDARTEAIVSGTIDLVHRLGLRLVAEGVEDDATLAALAAMGCDATQGFLHARPASGPEFRSWLAATVAAAT